MQRSFCSFIKNGKECKDHCVLLLRMENDTKSVLFFWKEQMPNPATDRRVQFTLAVWSISCQRVGIQHNLTTAYHPQANGMIERFHS